MRERRFFKKIALFSMMFLLTVWISPNNEDTEIGDRGGEVESDEILFSYQQDI